MRAAAVSSASRCAFGRPSNAARSSAGASSSEATLAALNRSKRAVYSSSAASPRARTSATIAATVASIAGSCAVSNAISAASCASNPGAALSSRRSDNAGASGALVGSPSCSALRYSPLGRPGGLIARSWREQRGLASLHARARERVEQRLHHSALQLERSRIDDQPRADRHDRLDFDEIVRRERAAARYQVDDRIGETGARRELHRAVQLDQVDVHAFRRKMLARGAHVLGRHADARAALHVARPIEAPLGRDREAAARDLEIERLIETVAAVLEQHVLAGDAEIGGAVFDVRRHVRSADDDDRQVGPVRAEDQLTRGLRIVGRHDAHRREQRQRFVEDAPLGQGERQRGHGANPGKTAILPDADARSAHLLPRVARPEVRRLVAARAIRIDVDAPTAHEARADGEPLRPASLPDVGENALGAMLVKARMAAKGNEIAQQARTVDTRPAIGGLDRRIVGLTGDRTHRTKEPREQRDRKSTRLNSSHVKISYAVFCLKKKKKKK